MLNGPFSGSVENNVVEKCGHVGLKTAAGNISTILNNEVVECRSGLEVENSCPKVMKNNLARNLQFGLSALSKMNGECRPILRFNSSCDNKKGGILVSGNRNRAEVSNNVVGLNQGVGIRVEANAHPHIFLN